MPRLLHLCFLAVSLLAVRCVEAQHPEVSYRWIGEAGGIYLGRAGAVLQDHLGFLWIATYSGLYKFDGYEFTVYIHEEENPASISSNSIERLYEDSGGHLWIGTARGGLNRYNRDSDNFTRFVHDPHDSKSIPPGQVRAIWEDRRGNIWVRSHRGLNQLDPATGEFNRYVHPQNDPPALRSSDIRSILEDRQGRLWIGTGQGTPNGIFRYDPKTEEFIHFVHDPKNNRTLFTNQVESLFEDSRGSIWVGCEGGVFHRFDPDRRDFERYVIDPSNPRSLKDVREDDLSPDEIPFGVTRGVLSIVERSEEPGILWLGTDGMGFLRFDVDRRDFTDYSDMFERLQAQVWNLIVDREGMIWMGANPGIYRIDPDASYLRRYVFSSDEERFMNQPVLGEIGAGSAFVDIVFEEKGGDVWISYSDFTVDRLDKSSGTLHRMRAFFPADIRDRSINGRLMDRSGQWWFGERSEGLIGFDPTTHSISRYPFESQELTFPAGSGRLYIYEDRQERLWVHEQARSLALFDRKTGVFEKAHLVRGDTVYTVGRILSDDSNGDPWMSLYSPDLGGIGHVRDLSTDFEFLPLGNFWYKSFAQDSQGRRWAGTLNDGLRRLDSEMTRSSLAMLVDGTPINQEINAIFEDGRGNVYFHAGQHFLRFDAGTNSIVPFNMTPEVRPEFYLGRDDSGILYFRDNNGVIAIDVGLIEPETLPPPVRLTDFHIDNQTVSIGNDSPLEAHISVAQSITLAHHQADIAIEFAALGLGSTEGNTYAYRLVDYDEAWIDAGSRRMASYTNLDPGEYVFQVRAANSQGVWNEEGASIHVNILPPWWRTIWAYIGYGLFFFAGIAAADRIQRRRLIARERQLAQIREAKLETNAAQALSREAEAQARALEEENKRKHVELEKAKEIEQAHAALEASYEDLQQTHTRLQETQEQLIHAEKMASLGQLTAGIAHEIKNPLNFVNNFSRLSLGIMEELAGWIEQYGGEDEKEAFGMLKMNAEKIAHHGDRADSIVRAMLEHSRIGHGERRPIHLNKLLDEYVNLAYHGMRARTDAFKVELVCDFDESIGEIEVSPQEMGRVFMNLLSNAFYAVYERVKIEAVHVPRVCIKTALKEGGIEVEIQDNGVGIPRSIRDKIFEPFYTTKPSGSGSTGLGLSLSHDIVVKGHGGELTVKGEEGEGATFIVRLPA